MRYVPEYLNALDIKFIDLKYLFVWIKEKTLNLKELTTEEKNYLVERLEAEVKYHMKKIENIQLFLELTKNPDELFGILYQSYDLDRLSEKTGLSYKMILSILKDFRLGDLTVDGIRKIEIKLKRLCLLKDELIVILEELNITEGA